MGKKVSGTIESLTVDGKPFTIGEGTFTVNVDGKERTMKPNSPYYEEKKTNTFIKGTVMLVPGIKSKEITGIVDKTTQLVGANGTTYVLKDANYCGAPNLDVSGGIAPVEFGAGPDDGKEITP